MQQIRISATGKVREALNNLRKNHYPLLSDAEIIKVVLSQAFVEAASGKYFTEKLDKKTSDSMETSRQQIKCGNYQLANDSIDLIAKLKK